MKGSRSPSSPFLYHAVSMSMSIPCWPLSTWSETPVISAIKLRDISSRLQHHIDTGGMQSAKVVSLRWSVNQVLQPADAPIHVQRARTDDALHIHPSLGTKQLICHKRIQPGPLHPRETITISSLDPVLAVPVTATPAYQPHKVCVFGRSFRGSRMQPEDQSKQLFLAP